MIKKGDIVKFKPEFMDEGDEQITFIAIDDESKGRVTVQAQLGWAINPNHVALTEWILSHGEADSNSKCKNQL